MWKASSLAPLLGGGASPIADTEKNAALLGGGAIPIADTEIKKEADPFGSAPCISRTLYL